MKVMHLDVFITFIHQKKGTKSCLKYVFLSQI